MPDKEKSPKSFRIEGIVLYHIRYGSLCVQICFGIVCNLTVEKLLEPSFIDHLHQQTEIAYATRQATVLMTGSSTSPQHCSEQHPLTANQHTATNILLNATKKIN